jgi:CheY-like chemotaxis protein
VLVIDDNQHDVELLRLALDECGMPDVCAWRATGATALIDLRLANATDPGWPRVVLVDVNLPGIDGFEVIARLRAEMPGSEAILAMWSSSDALDERLRAEAAGVPRFVKPSDYHGFLQVAHWLIAQVDPAAASAPPA